MPALRQYDDFERSGMKKTKPRIVVYDLDDGWHGIYIDGRLFAGTDNWGPQNLYDLLVFGGLLEKGTVEFKADFEFDQKVSYSGVFPERDPNENT